MGVRARWRERERGGRESTCQWVCVKLLCTPSSITLRKTTCYSVKFYTYVSTN